MTADDRELLVDAMDQLLRSPGWELLKVEMEKRKSVALSGIAAAKDSHELARHTYTYMTWNDVLNLAELHRNTLAQQLQQTMKRR